jgi:cysteine desulfurase/selenocysteine lyase
MDTSKEFPQSPDIAYLNHAAVAPIPLRAQKAVQELTTALVSSGARQYPDWLKREARLRQHLAQLLNVSTEEIALVKNTSEALSMVAFGIQWQPGDRIVIPASEFPSNRMVWEEAARRFGLALEMVNIHEGDATEALLRALSKPTRLLSLSTAQYADGLMPDLSRISAACQATGTLLCLDAIQTLGAVRLDLQAIKADFVMADGHKWLLGPEGLGLMFVRKRHLDHLILNELGWHSVEDAGNYDRTDWRLASSARRFECGTPNMLGIFGLEASVSLLLETGLDQIEQAIFSKTSHLWDALSRLDGIRLTRSRPKPGESGIVQFRLASGDAVAMHKALVADGIICACRGGGIRLSPHFYTPDALLDRAVSKVGTLLGAH